MPIWTNLISVDELASNIDHCLVIDCRHDLMNREVGQQLYAQSHLPAAHFLHQDDDLAGAHTGSNGRHPLPDPSELLRKLRHLGMTESTQLVAYDANGGSQAGRLWWLARWLGHQATAVLDGGMPAWQRAGFPVTTEVPQAKGEQSTESAKVPNMPAVTADFLMGNIQQASHLVIDARSAERFRGDAEPIDPVAGHIPGAINRPFQQNMRPDGTFKPAAVLRQEFEALLNGRDPSLIVHSCGSGVSALHNMLAMEFSGLTGSALYPGSWSEWCADPARPLGTGDGGSQGA